jgi:hypothetical protein
MEKEFTNLHNHFININKNYSEEQLEAYFLKNPEESIKLLNNIQWFLQKVCQNPNRINEKISLLTESLNKDLTIIHNKDSYGPDLILTDQTNKIMLVEEKTSLTTKKKKFKSNFNFSISNKFINRLDNENTEKIIKSIYEMKVRKGYVIFNVKYEDNLLFTKKISGEFISLLITKMCLKTNTLKINLGCQFCDKCKQYHRIMHLSLYDQILKERIEKDQFVYKLDYFTETEWEDILNKRIPSKCPK